MLPRTNKMEKTKKLLVGNPNQLEVDGQIGEDELSYVVMNLPFGCNYSCSKCYRDDNKSSDSIDLDTRLKVISQAKDLGARVLCIPGEGEPLTNRDLTMQLIDHANAVGLISILYTNGSFLNRDTVDKLFNKKVTLITSLDSLKKLPFVYKIDINPTALAWSINCMVKSLLVNGSPSPGIQRTLAPKSLACEITFNLVSKSILSEDLLSSL